MFYKQREVIPVFEIRETRQIRSIASPARQAILDALESLGPSSADELSDVLDRPRDRLYYHLKLLQRCGLVIRSRGRSEAGRLSARFDLRGRPTQLRYAPHESNNVVLV